MMYCFIGAVYRYYGKFKKCGNKKPEYVIFHIENNFLEMESA